MYGWLNPSWLPLTFAGALSILGALALFTGLNHLLVGLVVVLARGQKLTESGVFGRMTLLLDFGLLCLGAIAALIWLVNPATIILIFVLAYLLYNALRVPALQRQVETDPKTGLLNARHFTEKLKEELARAQRFGRPLTVVMADLDLLREVNNKYGHLAGDVVLKGVAQILKEAGRDYDMTARFGGEEFAILMPETSLLEAQIFVEEMRHQIEEARFTVSTSPTPINVTMSFGVAEGHDQDKSIEDLLHRADIAVYQAKQNGRNQVCVFSEEQNTPWFFQQGLQEQDEKSSATNQVPPSQAHQLVETNKASEQAPPKPVLPPPPAANPAPAWRLQVYITSTIALALGLTFLLVRPSLVTDWPGILLFTALAVFTEIFGIEIYVRNTSVSTSAAPLLAGVLLFGPMAALCIGPAIAVVAYIKYRSPLIRFFFNTSNHLLGGLFSACLILLSGRVFNSLSLPLQITLATLGALVIYLSTTSFVAGAISIDKQLALGAVWTERFRWLAPYYAALGIVAYALVFSYQTTGLIGVCVSLVPLFMLRYSQMQYVKHTETMVNQLRTQNSELMGQAAEISLLNDEILHVLANALDLRDPYVLKHSHHVAQYSMLIAQELGMAPERVEIVRKAGLLHDIGKLGIPESVLYKPTRLTDEEYELVKEHVYIGAELVQGCHSLHEIVPFILHHHEYYNGKGYPNGLAGADIPLEARILGLADAIEAMASDRPYHKALTVKEILSEISRCAGTQFDPAIVHTFMQVLERMGEQLIVNSARSVTVRRAEPRQLMVKEEQAEPLVTVIG
ncbi:MAG: diguanylate cyclase [Caldilineaceae bacterium]